MSAIFQVLLFICECVFSRVFVQGSLMIQIGNGCRKLLFDFAKNVLSFWETSHFNLPYPSSFCCHDIGL